MKKYSSSTKKMTIGLDVGDQYSYYVVLDGEAEVIEEGRIRTREEALGKKFAGLPKSRVALEVGTHSCWISQLLQGLGHEAVVAVARKLAVLMHHLWVTGEVYEPLYNTHRQAA